ncbi:hypothetical protein NDU88_002424 [Pleurodeles waltl]|uniref:Uncharacterized protein n=1 Tax=Pleurodeles waltl TaxID=8319 RepID=A0AAV7TKM5_PLEWA|nr:hypothetical protein NDU88_002424 [Pleurodeles waltl]
MNCPVHCRPRLPCSPSRGLVGRQEAAAPGDIATGSATAAPFAPYCSRRGPASPNLAPFAIRGALAASVKCTGLPRSGRRPGRCYQAAGGAPSRMTRSGRRRSARIKRPSRTPSWLLPHDV